MDEFGVLTERFGLKPQGKSAPMASSKRPNSAAAAPTRTRPDSAPNHHHHRHHQPSTHAYGGGTNSFGNGSFVGGSTKAQSFGGSSDDGFDIFDGFDKSSKQSSNGGRSSFDYDSIFSGGNRSNGGSSFGNDDIFGGIGGLGSSNSASNDDIFGSFGSKPKQGGPIDDLLGDFGLNSGGASSVNRNGSSGFDDLVPGFSSSTTSHKGSATSGFTSVDDPFVVLESTSTATNSSFVDPLEELTKFSRAEGGSTRPANGSSKFSSSLKPPPKPGQVLKSVKVKSSHTSSIDELEEFATSRVRATPNRQSEVNYSKQDKERENGKFRDAAKKTPQKNVDDFDSIFGMGSRSSSVPKSRSSSSDPLFDATVNSRGKPQVSGVNTSGTSSSMRKASSAANMFDDFSSLFGAASPSGEFEEVEGETEERRRARLERHQRTKHRVAQAVADMNQRDYQTQREQEERRMIAEKMDLDIKRWAAGKEGNMRALLSSLQYVLWTECGWDPVSLTDLITSSSVKKVYRKATLCVHPDKVQQKGATLEQKYIAEKVFDILKEAWNKFNKEELS
ncbi:Auxilin-related protein 2 [Linum grandiflorum]